MRNLSPPLSSRTRIQPWLRCWIRPDKSIPLGEVLKHLRERVYHGLEEVEAEAERIWPDTGLPSGEEVEESSE